MTIPHMLRALLVVAVGGAAGFCLRGLAPHRALASSMREVPRLEYFATADSFSEAEQARAVLRAIALRQIYTVQTRLVEALRQAHSAGGEGAAATAALDQAVQELEEAVQEGKDTAEESVLTNALLLLLGNQRSHQRWVEVYLDLLYRRPTEPIIGRLAESAVVMGQAAGRIEDVLDGFRHVSEIPFDLESRRRVQAVLAGTAFARNHSLRCAPAAPATHDG